MTTSIAPHRPTTAVITISITITATTTATSNRNPTSTPATTVPSTTATATATTTWGRTKNKDTGGNDLGGLEPPKLALRRHSEQTTPLLVLRRQVSGIHHLPEGVRLESLSNTRFVVRQPSLVRRQADPEDVAVSNTKGIIFRRIRAQRLCGIHLSVSQHRHVVSLRCRGLQEFRVMLPIW
jgi:hypothetical protein